jgi:hypothetical protein
MKKIQKILFAFFLSVIFELAILNFAQAEIIDIQSEEKNFGDWKVFCENDAMMDLSHCKLASKFFENSAVITIEPNAKFLTQLFVVIPQVEIGSFVKIRVDKNDLILSKTINSKDFGLIPLVEEQKIALYRQIKTGDFLFFRFSVRGSEKEVTAKINLKDFRSALGYYNAKISK